MVVSRRKPTPKKGRPKPSRTKRDGAPVKAQKRKDDGFMAASRSPPVKGPTMHPELHPLIHTPLDLEEPTVNPHAPLPRLGTTPYPNSSCSMLPDFSFEQEELHPIFRRPAESIVGSLGSSAEDELDHLVIPPGLRSSSRGRRRTPSRRPASTSRKRRRVSSSSDVSVSESSSSESSESSDSSYSSESSAPSESVEGSSRSNYMQTWGAQAKAVDQGGRLSPMRDARVYEELEHSADSGFESDTEINNHDDEDEMDVSDVDDMLLRRSDVFGQPPESPQQRQRRLKRRKKKRGKKERLLFNQRKHRKRKTAATESEMSPEVEDLIKRANNAYLERNIPLAISFLEETIQKAPGLHDPFHLLGLIHEEELGDKTKALDFYYIGAHLVPEDQHLWRRVGSLAQALGKIKQAIYCFNKCLSVASGTDDRNPLDEAAAFDVAMCYIVNGQYAKAARRLEELIRLHPGDILLGRELAKCYHQLNDHSAAIVTLESCVFSTMRVKEWESLLLEGHGGLAVFTDSDHYDDAPCVSGRREERSVMVYDPHGTNMLAEVYVEARKFEQCEKLLSSILRKQNLKDAPLDLVVKLAASQVYLHKVEDTAVFDYSMSALLQPETSRKDFSDLYVLLGEALFQQGRAEEALKLFKEVAGLEAVRADASTWVKIARCQLQSCVQSNPDQESSMERLIRDPDSAKRADLIRNLRGSNTDARLLLSQVLTKLGRTTERGLIMRSLPAEDLAGKHSHDESPVPLTATERLQMLDQLQCSLDAILPICSKAPEVVTVEEQAKRQEWITTFVRLLEESEQDTQRVLRENFERRLGAVELDRASQKTLLNELGRSETDATLVGEEEWEPSHEDGDQVVLMASSAMVHDEGGERSETPAATQSVKKVECVKSRKSRRPTGQRNIQHSLNMKVNNFRVKKELGLLSVEDVLGWKNFWLFLEIGIGIVMKSAGMFRPSVELIETILSNKRSVKIQRFNLDRRMCQAQLKRLSLHLAIEGGLYRIALSYIRKRYLRRPDSSDRTLQAFGRLLFCGPFCHSTVGGLSPSIEKDALLENRAWCIRQLLQRPHSFILTLLTGHFCSLASRWPVAIAEYTRAHRLVPNDDLTCLCLATAFLSFATSRNVQNRHAAVLRGFAVLSIYSDQRRLSSKLAVQSMKSDLCPSKPRSLGFSSETTGEGESESPVVDSPKPPATQNCFITTIELVAHAMHSVYDAEILYNMARSFHQLNLLHSALPLYLECLQRLPEVESIRTMGSSLPPSILLPATLTVDAPQIRFCASHNLALIYKARGASREASSASLSSIVWEGD